MCELTTAGDRPPGQLDGRTPRPDQTHQDEVADSEVSAIHLVKETDRSKRWLGRDRLSTEEYGMSTALYHWLLNGYGNKGSEMFDWSNVESKVVTDEAGESRTITGFPSTRTPWTGSVRFRRTSGVGATTSWWWQ